MSAIVAIVGTCRLLCAKQRPFGDGSTALESWVGLRYCIRFNVRLSQTMPARADPCLCYSLVTAFEPPAYRKPGSLQRSSSPTWSARAGSLAPTRTAPCRASGRCAAILIDPTIAVHHGRVVKRTGDGILIEFGQRGRRRALRDGVQNGMVNRLGLPPERRINSASALHVGDVEADTAI